MNRESNEKLDEIAEDNENLTIKITHSLLKRHLKNTPITEDEFEDELQVQGSDAGFFEATLRARDLLEQAFDLEVTDSHNENITRYRRSFTDSSTEHNLPDCLRNEPKFDQILLAFIMGYILANGGSVPENEIWNFLEEFGYMDKNSDQDIYRRVTETYVNKKYLEYGVCSLAGQKPSLAKGPKNRAQRAFSCGSALKGVTNWNDLLMVLVSESVKEDIIKICYPDTSTTTEITTNDAPCSSSDSVNVPHKTGISNKTSVKLTNSSTIAVVTVNEPPCSLARTDENIATVSNNIEKITDTAVMKFTIDPSSSKAHAVNRTTVSDKNDSAMLTDFTRFAEILVDGPQPSSVRSNTVKTVTVRNNSNAELTDSTIIAEIMNMPQQASAISNVKTVTVSNNIDLKLTESKTIAEIVVDKPRPSSTRSDIIKSVTVASNSYGESTDSSMIADIIVHRPHFSDDDVNTVTRPILNNHFDKNRPTSANVVGKHIVNGFVNNGRRLPQLSPKVVLGKKPAACIDYDKIEIDSQKKMKVCEQKSSHFSEIPAKTLTSALKRTRSQKNNIVSKNRPS